MRTKIEKSPKVLIVEDQLDTLRSLEYAVGIVFPKYYPAFQGYDIARCYREGEDAIEKNRYDFVLLDHIMPVSPFPEPEKIRNGGSRSDLTDEEKKIFLEQEEENWKNSGEIGYGLISLIKKMNAQTVVIGTSSMSNEIRRFPQPDYQMKKYYGKAEEDLEAILGKISKE